MTAADFRIDLMGRVDYGTAPQPRFEVLAIGRAHKRRSRRVRAERPALPCVVCGVAVAQPRIGRPRTHCDPHASCNARWYRRHHKVTLAAECVRGDRR